jgi:hypothetical protein
MPEHAGAPQDLIGFDNSYEYGQPQDDQAETARN